MILLIDKPKGITSHDVVDRLRAITGERRIGHAGTLDPNATGLLIVGVGRESTKKLGQIATGTTKTYEAEVILGETRDTDDTDGIPLRQGFAGSAPDLKDIKEALKGFVGEQMQMPPAYSAIKLQGKKAYELARKGQKPDLKARSVVVHSIKLINYEYPILNIVCEVSAGTYIRSIARDLGEKLKTGAYLNNLRRTKIGEFSIQDAVKLDKLKKGI